MLKVFYLNVTDADFAALTAGDFRPWTKPEQFAAVLRFKSDKVRREKWLGEWMIRSLLARLWGWFPGDYDLLRGVHGKPYLAGNSEPVYFNISHSGDYIVCAVSDREVGVDVEKIGKERLPVARRFFHPDEIRCLEAREGTERTDLFYAYWAVKESFVKYKGAGLSCPLSSFLVLMEGDSVQIWQNGSKKAVSVCECRIDTRYKCFVCAEGNECPGEVVRLTQWMPLEK